MEPRISIEKECFLRKEKSCESLNNHIFFLHQVVQFCSSVNMYILCIYIYIYIVLFLINRKSGNMF